MTRAELEAAIQAVLDQPRTDPDRLNTIMALVDAWTRALVELADAVTGEAA